MTAEGPAPKNEDSGRVLRFERRGAGALRGRTPFAVPPRARLTPVEDAEKYTFRLGSEDDRQRNNAAASLILIILIVCGVWLTDRIIAVRDRPDCVLGGHTNCSPIEHPNRPTGQN